MLFRSSAGYVRGGAVAKVEAGAQAHEDALSAEDSEVSNEPAHASPTDEATDESNDSADEPRGDEEKAASPVPLERPRGTRELVPPGLQASIEFGFTPSNDEDLWAEEPVQPQQQKADTARGLDAIMRQASVRLLKNEPGNADENVAVPAPETFSQSAAAHGPIEEQAHGGLQLPPLISAANLVREVPVAALKTNIRPLGQLEDSFIVATDDEGLLLIDQQAAHERILFEKYRALENRRGSESQNLLMPETFDLTPAQVAAFDVVAPELEAYGFGLMRLSGRTVAIKAVPADLPAGEARNMLAEILDTVEAEKRGAARTSLHERIAARLARGAAIKASTLLSIEKMRWLIDNLLLTSSPITSTQGRPVVLRLAVRDIEKSFQRS